MASNDPLDYSHLHVTFFLKPEEDKKKSKIEGRPIHHEVEYVDIQFKGETGRERRIITRADYADRYDPVTNEPLRYKDWFHKEYEAFKRGVEYHGDGTPLTEVNFLSRSQVEDLRALKLFTVEDVAGADHNTKKRLGMWGDTVIRQAQAYLDEAAGRAPMVAMANELAQRDARLALLEAEIERLKGAGISVPDVSTRPSDPYEIYGDDDLKAMIKDATGAAPAGNPKRSTLIAKLEEIAAQREKEAA